MTKRRQANHSELPSGYEADGERGAVEEEEEEMTVNSSSGGSLVRKRTSLEVARKRFSHSSRSSHSGRRRGRRSLRFSSSSSSSSRSSSSTSSSCLSSDSQSSNESRVKRLRLSPSSESSDDENDGAHTIFVGRTSCRSHGQYPKRYRTRQREDHQARSFLVLRRGGVVGGTASNLNDQEALVTMEKKKPSNKVTLHLISQVLETQRYTAEGVPPFNPDDSLTRVSSEASINLSNVAPPPSIESRVLPDTLQPISLSSIHCKVAPTACNIAEALSFSPRARVLLEAEAPHHVVHRNGAYESFLQKQGKRMPPELLGTMEYSDLTVAVKDLFANQAVTLHSVVGSAQMPDMVVTHFLLELAPAASADAQRRHGDPLLPRNVSSSSRDVSMPVPLKGPSASFLNDLPARAVG